MASTLLEKYLERSLEQFREEHRNKFGQDTSVEDELDYTGIALRERLLDTESSRDTLGFSQLEAFYEVMRDNLHLRQCWSEDYRDKENAFQEWVSKEVLNMTSSLKLSRKHLQALGLVTDNLLRELKDKPVVVDSPFGKIEMTPESIIYGIQTQDGKYKFDMNNLKRIQHLFGKRAEEYFDNLGVSTFHEFKVMALQMLFEGREEVADFIKRCKNGVVTPRQTTATQTHAKEAIVKFSGRRIYALDDNGEQHVTYLFDELEPHEAAVLEQLLSQHVEWQDNSA